MAIVLDAGALIKIGERDRNLGAMLRVAAQHNLPVRTSAAVVAQVWRDGAKQANLARILAGTREHELDHAAARRIGGLLRASNTADVVDAHVALLTNAGDTVITSDKPDLDWLLDALQVKAHVLSV
jgi:hypothetical protein